MSTDLSRQTFAQLAIAVAVCAGIYAFVGSPLRERMLEAEASLTAAIDKGAKAQVLQVALPALLAQQEATRARAAEIEARSLPASDESISFSEIMKLADDAGVEVRQITPVSLSNRGAGSAGDDAQTRPGDKTSRFTITGIGTYADTARFLELLGSPWAYCSIRQCRIAPDFSRQEANAVSFSCTLELYAVDASPVDLAGDSLNPAEASK